MADYRKHFRVNGFQMYLIGCGFTPEDKTEADDVYTRWKIHQKESVIMDVVELRRLFQRRCGVIFFQ